MKDELNIRDDFFHDGLATYIAVDEKTGVNYIICKYYNYSNNGGGVSMIPRLNADGSLYVAK